MKCIELSKGFVAIVDDEDFERVAQLSWHVDPKGYAVRKQYNPDGTKKHILMHRFILRAEVGQIIDHRNMNTLDNRRENLRFCTVGNNRSNTHVHRNNSTGFKGVRMYPRNKTNPFCAQISHKGSVKNLGYFKTAEQAHEAYKKAAAETFGEFARFN